MKELKVVSSNSQNGNCYYLEYEDGKSLLLDCGVTYKKLESVLGKRRISKIDTIFISHIQHADHFRDSTIKRLAKDNNITLVISEDQIDKFLDKEIEVFDLVSEDSNNVVEVNGVVFNLIELLHFNGLKKGDEGKSKCECYGCHLVIGDFNLLFITDTGEYIPTPEIKDTEFDIVLLECNYNEWVLRANGNIPWALKERIKRSHLSTKQYIEIKNQLTYKEIIPIHLSKQNQLPYDRIIGL